MSRDPVQHRGEVVPPLLPRRLGVAPGQREDRLHGFDGAVQELHGFGLGCPPLP